MLQSRDQQAFLHVTRHDRGSRFATVQQALPGVDEQATTELFGIGRMAFIAMFDEDGPNLRFKEFEPLTFDIRIRSPSRARSEQNRDR